MDRSRNIVLLSDGTGNSVSSPFKTNVRRIYDALDLVDPAEPKHPRQFAFYDDGVGTSSFRPLAILGGIFGLGLKRNVLQLYAFLCRTWRPGDRIYAFGFSRGAFTIRVLIGLIMSQGVVPYDGDEAKLERNIRAAFRAYRRARYYNLNPFIRPLRIVRDAVIGQWNTWIFGETYDPTRNRGRSTSTDPVDPPVGIAMVGVWDTVDAYGLPIEELTRAVDLLILPLTLPNGDLNARVRRACHALCLDDERRTFHPRLFNETPHRRGGDTFGGVEGANRETTHVREERVTQIWFAGAHADVGGGYPDGSLSFVSFNWILDEAEACGLRFTPFIRATLAALADENGPRHDSRRGLAGYYRYQPRHLAQLCAGPPKPLFAWVRKLLHRSPRLPVRVERPKIHESVFRRISAGQDGYAPIGLPPQFAVVRFDGSIVDGHRFLTTDNAGATTADETAQPAPSPPSADQRAGQQEHVWNWVWRRRVIYFATLFATLLLVTMPAWRPAGDAPTCEGPLCFLSGLVGMLGAILPSMAEPWVANFSSHPTTFGLLALAIYLLMWRGSRLEERISDDMRRIWYAFPGLAPRTGTALGGVRPAGRFNLAIEAVRTHGAYRRGWNWLAWYVLPALAFVATGYLGLAVLNHAGYAARESAGYICTDHAAATPVVAGRWAAAPEIDTRNPCNATGLRMQAGTRYVLRLAVPAADHAHPWRDGTLPADPNGLADTALSRQQSLVMAIAAPLRREWGADWFRLMARIGSQGSDVYALKWQRLPPQNGKTIYLAELTARRDSPLFLYVNDAGIAFHRTLLYENNRGIATLHVQPHPGAALAPPGD